ncbi:hypothetical protein DEIPH_ctg019orf0036 [Deinococcus phoenicis]|uniref:SMP-30/Gluconolactonase/LRE-like region domain-containing protein n=1 Tax=Deinococcus phoenicis TaxID=1476583 RepID=A0A016QR69_9DEIO|nr:hypothetical protein DEIPH_ctg019orf0036 [Deinococcus phoenicis]
MVGVTASATPGETTTATVDIGGVKADFKVTTRAAAPTEDSTPDAFDFPDRSDLTPDEIYTSPAIKVSGINIPVTASAEGGLLSVNDGPHQPTATVKTGDSIKVVTQTPSTFAATKTVTVKIGTVSDTFTLTTLPADTTPDPFSFTDQKDVKRGSTVTSDEVTVTGINAPAPIAVTGGTLLINGQTSTQMTVKAGDKVVVQVTASSSPSTSVSATVTIGGKSAIFTVTTKAAPPADTTPDPFSFKEQKDVVPGSTVTSNEVTVTGINAPAPISVTGGTLLINGQTSTQTTVRAGDKVAVKLTSAATLSTPVSATVTIGGQSATFTVTTMPRVSEVADLNPYGPPWLMDLAIDHQSNLYITSPYSDKLLKVTPAGQVSTFADPSSGYSLYGSDIVYVEGNLYVAAESHGILKITPAGELSVLADQDQGLNFPNFMTNDAQGNLYVVDGSAVKKVTLDGTVSTFYQGQDFLFGLAVGADGSLYLADPNAKELIKIAPGGTRNVLADSAAGLSSPVQLALDAEGNLYVTTNDSSIQKVTPAGVVSTVATKADGLSAPHGLKLDGSGNLYVVNGNGKVLRIRL